MLSQFSGHLAWFSIRLFVSAAERSASGVVDAGLESFIDALAL